MRFGDKMWYIIIFEILILIGIIYLQYKEKSAMILYILLIICLILKSYWCVLVMLVGLCDKYILVWNCKVRWCDLEFILVWFDNTELIIRKFCWIYLMLPVGTYWNFSLVILIIRYWCTMFVFVGVIWNIHWCNQEQIFRKCSCLQNFS